MSFNQPVTKICIIGCSSSGKSTLADLLGKKYNMPVTHLDLLAHQEGTQWTRVPDSELIKSQKSILSQDSWIIDGNYSSCMQERFSAASTVIWLDFNVFFCLIQYLKRSLKSDTSRPGRLNGAKNEFSWRLIRHILRVYPKNHLKYESLLQQFPNLSVIRVHSVSELKRYYKQWGIVYE